MSKPSWCAKGKPCDYDAGSAYCLHRECRQQIEMRLADQLLRLHQIESDRERGTAAMRAAFGPELWALGHPAFIVVHLREEYAKVERLWKEACVARDASLLRLDHFTWRVIDHDDEKSFPEFDTHVLLASQCPNGIFTSEAWLVSTDRGLWHLEATDGCGDHQEVWGTDAKAWMPLPEFVVKKTLLTSESANRQETKS